MPVSSDLLFSDRLWSAVAIAIRSRLQVVQIRCGPPGVGILWTRLQVIVGSSPLSLAFYTHLDSVVLLRASVLQSMLVLRKALLEASPGGAFFSVEVRTVALYMMF